MSKVFISYRREDAAGFAQAIFGQLERHLRRDQIFMDVDTVEPGVDFVARIEQAVNESDVLLALIGKRWIGEQENGPPRIHDPHDFVHLEIATALARNIRVIPVLVDGAIMPSKDELPQMLQPLVRRQALELSNTRFRFDLEHVSEAVKKAIAPPIISKSKWRWRWYGGLSAIVVVLGIAVGLWFKPGQQNQTEKDRLKAEEAERARDEAEGKKQEEFIRLEQKRLAEARLVAGAVFRDRLKIGGEGPEMVVVPAGRFQMGDFHGSGDKDEKPIHAVRIQKRFAIGRYEVTFGRYEQFAKATGRELPSDHGWGRGNRPVIWVSWQDAMDMAKWLSDQAGKRYRLPTEAEWEYAARSGGKDEIWAGTSKEQDLSDYAWFSSNSNGRSQPVGLRKPNGLGLHDMSGNVWEWVEDCRHLNYDGAPSDGRPWLDDNEGNCASRMRRGGNQGGKADSVRSLNRGNSPADFRSNFIGFRLAQEIE